MSTKTPKKSDPTPAHLPHQSSAPEAEHDADAERWERENVHDVYSSIASHFSATRYKPWPLVSDFLASLPAGSIGIDVGCGNGKYLHLRNLLHSHPRDQSPSDEDGAAAAAAAAAAGDCLTIGLDRSEELIGFARTQDLEGMAAPTRARGKGKGKGKGKAETNAEDETSPAPATRTTLNEVAVGDGLTTSFRGRCFDYAISIATIHHFSTRARRRAAIQELIRLVQPVEPASQSVHAEAAHEGRGGGRGRFLVYVWALEQKGQERRKFDEEAQQERGDAVNQASVHEEATLATGRDVLVPWVMKRPQQAKAKEEQEESSKGGQQEEPVYQRYYHLFEETELESLVDEAVAGLPEEMRTRSRRRRTGSGDGADEKEQVSRLTVAREDSGWERGNWWGVWKVAWSEAGEGEEG